MFVLMTLRGHIIPGPMQPNSRTIFPGSRHSAERNTPTLKIQPCKSRLHEATGNNEKLKQAPVGLGVQKRREEEGKGREVVSGNMPGGTGISAGCEEWWNCMTTLEERHSKWR